MTKKAWVMMETVSEWYYNGEDETEVTHQAPRAAALTLEDAEKYIAQFPSSEWRIIEVEKI